jgi:hypothetical protein
MRRHYLTKNSSNVFIEGYIRGFKNMVAARLCKSIVSADELQFTATISSH